MNVIAFQPRRTPAPPPEHPEEEGAPVRIQTGRAVGWLVAVCVLIELLLAAGDATINYAEWSELGPIQRFFNITREDGVASWFAVTQTWMVGLTLWLRVGVLSHQKAPRRQRWGWAGIALFFSYMAVDDGSMLHERVGSAFEEANVGLPGALTVFPSYPWQLLFVPFFGAAGLAVAAFLWGELSPRRRLIVAAALSALAVAVGLDFIEGMDPESPANAYTWIRERWELTEYDVSHFGKSIEETLEMLANTLFWAVFCLELGEKTRDIRLKFY